MFLKLKNLIPVCLAAALTACGSHPIYSMGSSVVEDYADVIATPHILTITDVDATCHFGNNMAPFFASMNALTESPQKTLSMLYLLSANCSEQNAIAAELRSLRALQRGHVEEAKDARTEQKRWLKLTAERRQKSFESAMSALEYDYNRVDAECPEFDSKQDELVFLLGLLTGLQAILADAGAELAGGVPRNIAPVAERAATCLDDESWGRAPSAIRAGIWVLLPDLKTNKAIDPWEVLNASSRESLAFGVRIPVALQAIMAETAGNTEELTKAFALLREPVTPHRDFALVDAIAVSHATAVSDRQWTMKHGERTPYGEMGRSPFPQDEDEANDLDSLL